MELTTSAGEVFYSYAVGDEQASRAILIIHDWWGILDYNHQWADEFAKAGYQALVIDLYDGFHPADAKKAGEYMRSLNQEVTHRKLQTALLSLKKSQRKLAVLGWSFGGLQAQQATLQNPDLVDATIFFYCRNLLNKSNAKLLKGPVLAIFAETERTWPDKQAELEYVMAESNQILELRSYDADHGFVNPESPRFDHDASEDALKLSIMFLDKYLA